MMNNASAPIREGILLVDKPRGKTSFSLVSALRRKTGIQKIGHAGTLDPFATGVMVMLIGKNFTSRSNEFIAHDKEYRCTLLLGTSTDSFDCDGAITATSPFIPPLSLITQTLAAFQGSLLQTPPMFSAKKVGGKKLYELARKGLSIERTPVPITLTTTLLSYHYPHLELHITCSKGCYIRSLAHDIGTALGCGAHLISLCRLRSGPFHLTECINGSLLYDHS